MKKVILFFSFIFMLSGDFIFAQDKKETSSIIKSKIESRKWVFKAQTAQPTGGRMVQLTSDYDLTLSGDSLISYLPYYGRAFSAPIDPTKNSLEFNATDFEYNFKQLKKAWHINLKLNDGGDARQMNLSVYNNGHASLRVMSTNRQPITYSGYLVTKP